MQLAGMEDEHGDHRQPAQSIEGGEVWAPLFAVGDLLRRRAVVSVIYDRCATTSSD